MQNWSKFEVVLLGMVVGGTLTIGVFGWQYWMARRAWKQSLKHAPWPYPVRESWLGGPSATVTRIDRRKSA